MARVLVCDDELMNRKVASKILTKEGFEVLEAVNGEDALSVLAENRVELILMDLMMPVMDGYEAIEAIKKDEKLSSIPIIVISALSDRDAIIKGLSLGANEYLTKPFDLIDFKIRVSNGAKIGEYQNNLEQEVDKKTKELQNALLDVVNSEKDIIAILGKTAEYRDNETSMHTVRVGEMAALISEKFGWNEKDVELMRLAAPMHDIGKVGIEDSVLLKPGKLDDDEFKRMKEHSFIGHEILSQKDTPLLKLASEIAYTHHEKYNGFGYPRGLSGDEIPLSGAIVAVVDVFDALLSNRPYKVGFSLEKSLDIIKTDSGTHFNPVVVDIFLDNLDEILEIRQRFCDV